VKEIFQAFDKDQSGSLDFDEFLIALRVCKFSFISNLSGYVPVGKIAEKAVCRSVFFFSHWDYSMLI